MERCLPVIWKFYWQWIMWPALYASSDNHGTNKRTRKSTNTYHLVLSQVLYWGGMLKGGHFTEQACYMMVKYNLWINYSSIIILNLFNLQFVPRHVWRANLTFNPRIKLALFFNVKRYGLLRNRVRPISIRNRAVFIFFPIQYHIYFRISYLKSYFHIRITDNPNACWLFSVMTQLNKLKLPSICIHISRILWSIDALSDILPILL